MLHHPRGRWRLRSTFPSQRLQLPLARLDRVSEPHALQVTSGAGPVFLQEQKHVDRDGDSLLPTDLVLNLWKDGVSGRGLKGLSGTRRIAARGEDRGGIRLSDPCIWRRTRIHQNRTAHIRHYARRITRHMCRYAWIGGVSLMRLLQSSCRLRSAGVPHRRRQSGSSWM
jgi:hypothetical protein